MVEMNTKEDCGNNNVTQINKNIVNGVHYPSELAARLARDALEAAQRYYNLFFQTHPTVVKSTINHYSNGTVSNKNINTNTTTTTTTTTTTRTTNIINPNTNTNNRSTEDKLSMEKATDKGNNVANHNEAVVSNIKSNVTHLLSQKHEEKEQHESSQELDERQVNVQEIKKCINEYETQRDNELIARFVTPPPPPSLPSPLSSSLNRSMRAFDAAAAIRSPQRLEKFQEEQQQQQQHQQILQKEYNEQREKVEKERQKEKREEEEESTEEAMPETEEKTKQSKKIEEEREEYYEEESSSQEEEEEEEEEELEEEWKQCDVGAICNTNTLHSNSYNNSTTNYNNDVLVYNGMNYMEKSPTQESASSVIHTPLNVCDTQYHTFFPPILSHRRREEIIREILGHAPCSYDRWHWKRAFEFHHLHINNEQSNSLYVPHMNKRLSIQAENKMEYKQPQQSEKEEEERNMKAPHHKRHSAEESNPNNNTAVVTQTDNSDSNQDKNASELPLTATTTTKEATKVVKSNNSHVQELANNVTTDTTNRTGKKPFSQLNSLFNSRSASVSLRRSSPCAPRHSLLGPRQSPVSAEPAHPFPLLSHPTPSSHRAKHEIAGNNNFTGNAVSQVTPTAQEIPSATTTTNNSKNNSSNNNNSSKNNSVSVEDASFYTFPTSRQGPEYFHATAEDGTKTLIIITVGLPARGKTFLAQKICRLLNWHGSRAKVHNLQVMWRRLLLNELHEHDEHECKHESEVNVATATTAATAKSETHAKVQKSTLEEELEESLKMQQREENQSRKHETDVAAEELCNFPVQGMCTCSSHNSLHSSNIDVEHSSISSSPSHYVCTRHFEDLILRPESVARMLYLRVLESVAEDCRQFFLHGGEVVVINDDFVCESLRQVAEELLSPLATQLIYMEVMRDATANAHFDVLKVQDPNEYPPSSIEAERAMNDFKARVAFLESVYEPLNHSNNANNISNNKSAQLTASTCSAPPPPPSSSSTALPVESANTYTNMERSYIRVLNPDIVEAHGIRGYAASRIISYVMNLSQSKIQHPIYFLRHGESCYNPEDRIGGDPLLTEQGMRDAAALLEFLYSLKKHLRHEPMSAEKGTPPSLTDLSSSHHHHHYHHHCLRDKSTSKANINYNNSGEELEIWTSQLRRAIQTAELSERLLNIRTLRWSSLNEIHAGVCEGMSYDDVKECYPLIDHFRKQSKYTFRYPDGESYQDLVVRLEPVIMELENANKVIVVVAHQAVLRCLLAYFGSTSAESSVQVKVPHRTVWRCSYDSKGIASLDELYLDNTEAGFHLKKNAYK